MTVYQKKKTPSLKWLVALIVFLLAMGITFADVYGYTNTTTITKHRGDQPIDHKNVKNSGGSACQVDADNPPPAAIPEPTTILLLAGGLGAMYAVRRWRKSDV